MVRSRRRRVARSRGRGRIGRTIDRGFRLHGRERETPRPLSPEAKDLGPSEERKSAKVGSLALNTVSPQRLRGTSDQCHFLNRRLGRGRFGGGGGCGSGG